MAERGYGIYPKPDGEIYINFEKGIEGVPLESLVPPEKRGKAFDDFPVADYLGIANVVLVTPEEWQAYSRQEQSIIRQPGQQYTTEVPKPNLDALNLRNADGSMNAERTAELFKVVAAYYMEAEKQMALTPGIVAQCWQNGMNADQIISALQRFTGPDGQLDLKAVEREHSDPVLQVFIALKRPGTLILKPADIERLMEWLSIYPRSNPGFKDQGQRLYCLVFLGLVDFTGVKNEQALDLAGNYIWNHEGDEPSYRGLWRHIQEGLGKFPQSKSTTDFRLYQERLAAKLDEGHANTEIAQLVLELAKEGKVAVPTAPLCQAAWIDWQLKSAGTALAKETELINSGPMEWLPFDKVLSAIRQILRNQNYGLSAQEVEAYIADQGQPGLARQWGFAFGAREKTRALKDLGILTADGQWSEGGFFAQQRMAQNLEKAGKTPHFQLLRLKLHETHRADQDLPLTWALLNDDLNPAQIMLVKRLANIALSGGLLGTQSRIGDVLSPDQYQTLRQMGAWLNPPQTYQKMDGLRWLTILVSSGAINWKQWEQICSFIYAKLDQEPDPETLRDWLDGLVNFEGEGLHRQTPPKAFPGAKVGRNEPCPCGAGKKFKKCCGR